MKPIRMVDLLGQYHRIKADVDKAIQEVLESTAFIQGEVVRKFESELAAHTDSRFVITCGNGTDALQIALMALDLERSDEVLLPVHNYASAAEVIALLGLKPVFVDVDAKTFNIDPSLIETRLTKRSRVIIPVHLYGQCADMESIMKLAAKHRLHVVEDAAQSLGATYTFSSGETRQSGMMGVIGTTSFFPSKGLGCYGDGGALLVQEEALATRVRMIANHGQRLKYNHEILGVNSRLDALQAAILRVKLQHLATHLEARREVARQYDEIFAGASYLKLPYREPKSSHVFHQYTLQVDRRDELKEHLISKGVPTMIYYPLPLHKQKAYEQYASAASFPVAEKLAKTVLSLPIHTEMDTAQVEYIGEAINEFYNG